MAIHVTKPNLRDIAARADMTNEYVQHVLELVNRAMEPLKKSIFVSEFGEARRYIVERRGLGIINTRYGKFWVYSFHIDDRFEKYTVIVRANIDEERLIPLFVNRAELLLRTDSGCETGQILGDLTCECADQLHLAMKAIATVGEGMIVNIPLQDGRGMGFPFKLGTLWLQDSLGVDTIESAGLLSPNGTIDVRTYAGVICILQFFEISTSCHINLATNNPTKSNVFLENGYVISNYEPISIEETEYTRIHLRAKTMHLGHRHVA